MSGVGGGGWRTVGQKATSGTDVDGTFVTNSVAVRSNVDTVRTGIQHRTHLLMISRMNILVDAVPSEFDLKFFFQFFMLEKKENKSVNGIF